MATSVTKISNLALQNLSAKRISDISDSTREAVLCNEIYEQCRDVVLQDGDWRFATKRETLATLVATPEFGYAYAHQLPNDYIKMVKLEFEDDNYTIEDGDKLYTNNGTQKIKYISNSISVDKFPPMFVQALVKYMTSQLAYPLTQNRALEQQKMAEYMDAMEGAKTNDSRESLPREFQDDVWLNSRGTYPYQYAQGLTRNE